MIFSLAVITQGARNAPGVHLGFFPTTTIIAIRGGFKRRKRSQREFKRSADASCLSIVCCKKKILLASSTCSACKQKGPGEGKDIIYLCKAMGVEKFINCLGGCRKQ